MAGAVVILVVLVGLPAVVIASGGLAAAALGWLLQRDADVRHEGSELLDTNR